MDKLFSIALLMAMIRISTPLVLAGLGGMFSERSGIINIALEGMMLMGAFTGVAVCYYTDSPWLGVLAAMVSAMVLAWIHAIASIKFNANQFVSGMAINMFATGASIFLLRAMFGVEGTSPRVTKLPQWSLPFTEYSFNAVVYITILLVIVSWVVLFKTPLGLRIRAVGEHPHAADSVGINIYKIRYIAVIISGALAGLAGAHLSLGETAVFVRSMTGGRGFIALAALIFGKWHPIGLLAASLLFGYFEALQITLTNVTVYGFQIPSHFIAMIPYVMTIIVLAGFIGKSVAPAASGMPYEPELEE